MINELTTQIIETGKILYDKGLVPGASGNISCRVRDKVLVTASGCSLGDLTEQDVVLIDMDGNIAGDKPNPSSERLMHLEIYKKRPDVNCIIHAHAPKATTLAVMGVDLKSPMLAEAIIYLGKVPLIKYDTPSTLELAKLVAEGFTDNEAVLMANHGAVTCGKNLKDAFYKMETLEFVSDIYITTELLNKRNEVPAEKMQELLAIRESKK